MSVQSALVRRAMAEHRKAIIWLVALLIINLLAYGLVVYPLQQRVANVAEREQSAAAALTAAQLDHARVSGTLTGKDRAATELTTFYQSVLPANLSGARRLTHLRLQQMARQANLTFLRTGYEVTEERSSTLTRLGTEMELAGGYDDVRAFLHQLEIAPEFVVVDNVELVSDSQFEGGLTVRLQMSTYFRTVTP